MAVSLGYWKWRCSAPWGGCALWSVFSRDIGPGVECQILCLTSLESSSQAFETVHFTGCCHSIYPPTP